MTPTGSSLGWAPNACTLPTAQQPLRVAEFDTLFTTALRAVHRLGPGRVRLVLDGSAEASARDLARRETECCSFFTFDFTHGDDRLQLDVVVPDNHVEVLDALADRATANLPGQGHP